ncbi:Eco57I restriction-modification methylase domain-containing protein, partial [uncultured Alistipes sp.]|uniref:type IIG restriction enzyme/methyltransferase n=1 Tax=uncultured Alistipes sp. TaxID=538949 RepID=UPI00272AAE2E
MPELKISQSLNKAYRQVKIEKADFVRFKEKLQHLFDQLKENETEEKMKGDIMDFLKMSFYAPTYKIAPNGRIDCAIHIGDSSEAPVGVIFEVKTPNSPEMIVRNDINRKALQEIVLYYLRERVEKKNIQLKYLVATNIFEYFVFDAHEFERLLFGNKKLIKEFSDFSSGSLAGNTTDFFYKEIAAKYIDAVKDELTYTYFDLRDYRDYLRSGNDKKLIGLYKIFSPVHLLKLPFQNDSNSLNKNFYSELLHIMGLEEVGDKGKRVIMRKNPAERNEASMIENTINVLDAEDRLHHVEKLESYGPDRETQLFNIALELSINWINRILFLKLLEAQMIKYHKGDQSYAFMNPANIADYDELNRLFFQVLARKTDARTDTISSRYGKVPYLNSSLFEVSRLEDATIRISNLENLELPVWSGTVLKENNKPRYRKLSTLRYLLEFLDAYDFASEGTESIEEKAKTLINASVLGLIFEKINGHRDGSVFTPGAITMYMCREAIRKVVIQKFNEHFGWHCADYDELKNKEIEDLHEADRLVNSIRICDPAVGSGHFLVSALNEIIATKFDLGILLDCDGRRIKRQNYQIAIESDELIVTDAEGDAFTYIPGHPECQRIQEALFKEKRIIIENCLFGVDLNPNSVNICRLRLWIELLKNAYYTRESDFTELETLPNIDINIKSGNSLLHRFDLKENISQILHATGITIAEYKNTVAAYKNAHSKDEKRKLEELIARIKTTLKTEINKRDPKQTSLLRYRRELSDLQGQELFASEWTAKQLSEKRKREKKLNDEIRKLETYFAEIESNKMYLGAFEWRIEFPEILDDEGNFVGFDCVIGNPPYIQLQSMGWESEILGRMEYASYERTGDIYCLFYELGMKLLKSDCLLSFITSNKWMRAGYGESLRRYFVEHTDPIQLIDFAGTRVFDSATVDVNILTLVKRANSFETRSCSIGKDGFEINKLSDYFLQNSSICSFRNSESWVVLSPIELSIKQKIEAIGTP